MLHLGFMQLHHLPQKVGLSSVGLQGQAGGGSGELNLGEVFLHGSTWSRSGGLIFTEYFE